MIGDVVWGGLSVGSLYVLVAIAFNIVYIASGSFNFAQPQFLMVGGFVGFWVTSTLHLTWVLGALAGGLVGIVVGLIEEIIAVAPLKKAGQGHGELVTTIGWATVMQASVILIWDTDPHSIRLPGDTTAYAKFGHLTGLELGLIALAIVLAIAGHIWLRRTRFGLAAMATAEDPAAASLRGIPVRLMSLVSFGVAGGMLGALGTITAPKTFVIYTLGFLLLLKAFFALAVGGFGSHLGALIGGLTVGVIEAAVTRAWGPQYVNTVVLIVLLVVLVVRPQGIFGRASERLV